MNKQRLQELAGISNKGIDFTEFDKIINEWKEYIEKNIRGHKEGIIFKMEVYKSKGERSLNLFPEIIDRDKI